MKKKIFPNKRNVKKKNAKIKKRSWKLINGKQEAFWELGALEALNSAHPKPPLQFSFIRPNCGISGDPFSAAGKEELSRSVISDALRDNLVQINANDKDLYKISKIAATRGELRSVTNGDKVNHPSHYNSHPSGIECVQIAEHYGFNIGNVIKYCWRAGLKNSIDEIEDLKKAAWYLDREIKKREQSKK